MAKLKDYIRRYLPLSAVIDTLRRRKLALLNPENWDDRNDRLFMQRYKEKKRLSSLYAMCAAVRHETHHHWRVFTPGAEGACLELWRDPLEAALRESDSTRFQEVEYLTLPQVAQLGPKDLENLPFYKRKGFGAEEEYRVIAWSGEPQALALEFDIQLSWVKQIELNPWMPKPLFQSVKDTIKAIHGCDSIEFRQSTLIDNQQWRDAGDRVVGRKPGGPETTLSLKKRPTKKRRKRRRARKEWTGGS
ncbi:MAG: hypothetical protein WCD57_26210 [Acidobacteriaceae bacterium]